MKTFEHACGGCGKLHRVDAKCAGASITCRCGFQTLLPSLSELKEWAGTAVLDAPTAETITEMVARGVLPESPFCVECRAKCDVVPLIAVCGPARGESHSTDFASHGDALSAVVGGFLFFAAPFLPSGEGREPEVGRGAIVHVPVHICGYCWNLTLGYGTDTLLRVLVFVFSVVTGLLLLLWFAAPWLVFDLPFGYVMMAGAAAFAFWVVRRWNLARLAVRLRSCVKKTPLYAMLLEEYPEAKIVRGQSGEHA